MGFWLCCPTTFLHRAESAQGVQGCSHSLKSPRELPLFLLGLFLAFILISPRNSSWISTGRLSHPPQVTVVSLRELPGTPGAAQLHPKAWASGGEQWEKPTSSQTPLCPVPIPPNLLAQAPQAADRGQIKAKGAFPAVRALSL